MCNSKSFSSSNKLFNLFKFYANSSFVHLKNVRLEILCPTYFCTKQLLEVLVYFLNIYIRVYCNLGVVLIHLFWELDFQLFKAVITIIFSRSQFTTYFIVYFVTFMSSNFNSFILEKIYDFAKFVLFFREKITYFFFTYVFICFTLVSCNILI